MRSHAPEGYQCPFCALAKGRECEGLHSTGQDIICRDDRAMAFVASHWWKNNSGHVLVVPILHFENLYELPDDVGASIFAMSRRIAIALKNSYACDGVSTRQHNEPAGYQEVWHYHLRVFPRYENDRLYPADGHKRLTSPEERQPFVTRLKKALLAGGT
jgi:histidine triad (HIT) family protein